MERIAFQLVLAWLAVIGLAACATSSPVTQSDGTVIMVPDKLQVRAAKTISSTRIVVATTKGGLQGQVKANELDLAKTDLSVEQRKELIDENDRLNTLIAYADLADKALLSASSILTGLPCFTGGTCTDAQLADVSAAVAQALALVARAAR